jgi:hypothetical protein
VTRTPMLPADDPRMGRQLIARTYPDAGGLHELFTWAGVVKNLVCARVAESSVLSRPGGLPEPGAGRADEGTRVPRSGAYGFEEVTRTAPRYASLAGPHAPQLSLFADCRPLGHLATQQNRGASYKQLAAVEPAWGMTKRVRVAWYRVAEDLALTDRHASHLPRRLRRRAI